MAQDIKMRVGLDLQKPDLSAAEKAFNEFVAKAQREAAKIWDKAKNPPAGKSLFEDSLQSVQAKKQRMNDERQSLEAANRLLAEKERQLQRIARIESEMVRQSRDASQAQDLRRRVESQREDLEQARKIMQAKAAGGGGPTGGGGIPRGGITSISGAASALGIPGVAIGGIATAIAGVLAAETARRFVSEAPQRARVLQASAFNAQGQGGQLLESAFRGEGLEGLLFSEQRNQAAGIAQSTIAGRYSAFNGLNAIPGFALNGMALRGVLGNTAYGALSHGQFSQAGRAFLGRLGVPGQQEEFEAARSKEAADYQAQQYEALRSGPGQKVLTESREKYLRDWRRNLDFQRQFGQSEGGFRSFLGGINNAGFTDESGMGMAGSILGAGGSTRAATGLAGFGLQLGRQFDLTNAGQAIGALSGQLGGAQQTKEGLITTLAEGTRLGLNRSDLREENRRFVELAAGAISQTNAKEGPGVQQILDTFSKFMTGANTVSGIQAGQSAYEAFQAQSNVQSGPSAVLRWAGMARNPVLSKLTAYQRSSLQAMPEKEIREDNEEIRNLAYESNQSAKDIVKNMRDVIGGSLFVNPMTDRAVKRLRAAQAAGYGPLAPGQTQEGVQDEISRARGGLSSAIRLEQAGAGLNEKQLQQYSEGVAAGQYSSIEDYKNQIRTQAESKTSPRGGDETERQQAQISRMANELFTTLRPSIEAAADQTERFTANINALVNAMKSGDINQITNAQKGLYNISNPQMQRPQEQTHATVGGMPGH